MFSSCPVILVFDQACGHPLPAPALPYINSISLCFPLSNINLHLQCGAQDFLVCGHLAFST